MSSFGKKPSAPRDPTYLDRIASERIEIHVADLEIALLSFVPRKAALAAKAAIRSTVVQAIKERMSE